MSPSSWNLSLCIAFLAHVLDWKVPKRKLILHFFSSGLAKILSDTVHGLFPQHQCCKHTVLENTDQCCPYGTFCHENESISVEFTSLIVGVFQKISKEYTFLRFLPFNLLPKNVIWSDSQWLAKLVLAVQLWSLHKISDQKKRVVEDEWWTVGGMGSHDCCARLWISRSLGTSPGWGHCCVLGHNTLLSQCLSLSTGAPDGGVPQNICSAEGIQLAGKLIIATDFSWEFRTFPSISSRAGWIFQKTERDWKNTLVGTSCKRHFV